MAVSKRSAPKYYEIDVLRRSEQLRRWFVSVGLVLVAIICALDSYASHRRLPGVAIWGPDGPQMYDDIDTPRRHMDDMRIKYFTELFVRRFVGIDSDNLEMDLADALNMMTPRLRHVTLTEGRVADNRAMWKNQNVRTRFDGEPMQVRPGRYDPDQLDARIPVLVTGQKVYGVKFGSLPEGETEPVEWFVARIELERVDVTQDSIFGLAVNSVSVTAFATREALENHFRSKEG